MIVILYFVFWSQETKKAQKASKGNNEGNKCCVLDGTKHNHENLGILYFIVPK
jgi:hypothetical protein